MRPRILLLAFALCLSAALATTATAAATPQDAAPRVQLLIPLYSYPTWYNPPTYIWDDVAAANSLVPVTAIINPANGPGGGPPNSDYVVGLNDLRSAGVTILGYVYTSYGARDSNAVKADIDLYDHYFDIDGIFFDEVASSATQLAYYQNLYTYVLDRPNLERVVLNPGTHIDEVYVSTLSQATAIIYEDAASSWNGYAPDGYVYEYAPERFAMLAHSVGDSGQLAQLIDLATTRQIAYVYLTDDSLPNPWNSLPGFWSDEINYLANVNAGARLFVSSSTNGSAGGVNFADEDILVYNTATGRWNMVWDGSDVGVSGEVDAFMRASDGSFLLSLGANATLPGAGAVTNADIVRFMPARLGSVTAGTFSLYFDGSDVGLSEAAENIDGLTLASDGRLLISTTGKALVPGVTAQDEDLLAFAPTSLGEETAGTWALYFDGSDVGLNSAASEDVNAVWAAPGGDLYLSTLGAFVVNGASGDGADVFVCTPDSLGNNTSCTFEGLYWDGSAEGWAGEVVDALFVEP